MIRFALALAASLACAAPASAQVSIAFEFGDGLLPSATSGVTAFGDPEGSVASVAGGLLELSTLGGSLVQGGWIVDAPIDLRGALHVELRVRVNGMEGASHGGFVVLVADGVRECSLYFRPDGVAVNVVRGFFGTGSFLAFDHSAFHVYELDAPPRAATCALTIDDVPRLVADRPADVSSPEPWVAFGDAVNDVSDASVSLDYLRIEVPEAPGGLGAACAVAALGLRARRRRA